MHDAKKRELKVGDLVLIPAKVMAISPGDDYCNCTLESVFGRRPDGSKEIMTSVNTGVTLRANPGDENDLDALAADPVEADANAAENDAEVAVEDPAT